MLAAVFGWVQAGASMMDPNHFLMIVLSRFEVFHVFSTADIRKRYREANKVSPLLLSRRHDFTAKLIRPTLDTDTFPKIVMLKLLQRQVMQSCSRLNSDTCMNRQEVRFRSRSL